MSKQEAIDALNALTDGDPEAAHSKADDVLVSFLFAEGHDDIARAYNEASERVGFWYA